MSQYFTKVSAEDLKNNLTAYIQAAKEGKLYLCSSSVAPKSLYEPHTEPSESSVREHVMAYVHQLDKYVTPPFRISTPEGIKIDVLWQEILSSPLLFPLFRPSKKARKCREFNKYTVFRTVGMLRSHGVYDDRWNDSQLSEALEHTHSDSSYRSYLGRGFDEREQRQEVRRICEEQETPF